MSADPIPDINATIATAVNARIEAEVFQALAGDEVIGKYVTAALQAPVEVNDRSGYGKDKKPYMTVVLSKAIQNATKDACTRLILEEMPAIEAEIRKSLQRNINLIAEGMAN